MFEIKTILLILVIILFHSGTSNGEKYQCKSFGLWCYIEGLQLTRENSKIVPVVTDPSVEYIQLKGTVPILSRGICESFSSWIQFYAFEVSMEEIEDDAFQGCNELVYVNLQENNLIKVGVNAFKGLSKLEELWLWSNQLFDFDIEGILTNHRNLKEICLADNNFKCSRLREILDFLKTKNIKVDPYVRQLRKRDYTPDKIEDIHCLSDSQWESEFAKLSVERQALVKPPATTEKPATSTTPKPNILEELQKKQGEQISHLDEKLNVCFETLRNQTINQDEKFTNFQKDLKNEVATLNQKRDEDTKQFETLREEFDAKIDVQNVKIQDTINDGLNSFNNKLATMIEDQISHRFDDILGKLNTKISEQAAQILELKKENELTSGLLLILSTGIQAQDSKLKDLKGVQDETNTKFQGFDAHLQGLQESLEKYKNETLTECYKILDEKCSEDVCVTF